MDKSKSNEDVLTPEFLSSLCTSRLSNHHIKLKIDTSVMLLRNLDHSTSLCNGTRLIITRIANHVLETKIIYGKNIENIFYIHKISKYYQNLHDLSN